MIPLCGTRDIIFFYIYIRVIYTIYEIKWGHILTQV